MHKSILFLVFAFYPLATHSASNQPILLADTSPQAFAGSNPRKVERFANGVLFAGSHTASNFIDAIWFFDPEDDKIYRVLDIPPRSDWANWFAINDKIAFLQAPGFLWVLDLASGTTRRVSVPSPYDTPVSSSVVVSPTRVGVFLWVPQLFSGIASAEWSADSLTEVVTWPPTVGVTPIWQSRDHRHHIFAVFEEAKEATLWYSDLTREGTRILAELNRTPFPTACSFLDVEDTLYACCPDSELKWHVWQLTKGARANELGAFSASSARLDCHNGKRVFGFFASSATSTVTVFEGANGRLNHLLFPGPIRTPPPDGRICAATSQGVFFALGEGQNTSLYFLPADTSTPQLLERFEKTLVSDIQATTNGVVFSYWSEARGGELAYSDGRPGRSVLFDIALGPASSNPTLLTPIGDKVFFVANDGTHGPEPWLFSETTRNVRLIEDLNRATQGSLVFSPVQTEAGYVFYSQPAIQAGRGNFWITQGMPETTHLLFEAEEPLVLWYQAALDKLYYWAEDSQGKARLSQVDLKNLEKRVVIEAGSSDSVPKPGPIFSLVTGTFMLGWLSDYSAVLYRVVQDREPEVIKNLGQVKAWPPNVIIGPSRDLAFFALIPRDREFNVHDLWVSDGTANGTFVLANNSNGLSVACFGDKVLFACEPDVQQNPVLCIGNTLSRTSRILNSDAWTPGKFAVSSRKVVFSAFVSGLGGKRFWVSDGTPEGTRIVLAGKNEPFILPVSYGDPTLDYAFWVPHKEGVMLSGYLSGLGEQIFYYDLATGNVQLLTKDPRFWWRVMNGVDLGEFALLTVARIDPWGPFPPTKLSLAWATTQGQFEVIPDYQPLYPLDDKFGWLPLPNGVVTVLYEDHVGFEPFFVPKWHKRLSRRLYRQ